MFQVGVDEDSTADLLLRVRNPVLDADDDADSSEWDDLFPNINMVGMSYDIFVRSCTGGCFKRLSQPRTTAFVCHTQLCIRRSLFLEFISPRTYDRATDFS